MSTVDAVCKSDTEYMPLADHSDNPVLLQTVFRIHDILVWIRIWIRRSMPLTKWTRIFLFLSLTFRCHQKLIFLTSFFAYYFLKVHLHNFSKIESPKKSQNRRNRGFFLLFLLADKRIRIRIRIHTSKKQLNSPLPPKKRNSFISYPA
jgi:hypothetical protein